MQFKDWDDVPYKSSIGPPGPLCHRFRVDLGRILGVFVMPPVNGVPQHGVLLEEIDSGWVGLWRFSKTSSLKNYGAVTLSDPPIAVLAVPAEALSKFDHIDENKAVTGVAPDQTTDTTAAAPAGEGN